MPKGDTPPLMTDPPTPEQLKLTDGTYRTLVLVSFIADDFALSDSVTLKI